MALAIRSALLVLLIAGAALLLGLTGSTLRTGWIDPLDWLAPGAAAIIALLLLDRRRAEGWPAARMWVLVTAPILLLAMLAGMSLPWIGLALLVVGLVAVFLAARFALRLAPARRWPLIAALLVAALLVPRLAESVRGAFEAPAQRPLVGVMSAMPLQGVPMGVTQGLDAMESVGLRSPLWQALETRFDLRPLDALDDASLEGLRILFLAQPRALAPEELVALDAWVRRGGRVVILADPLLHWPDPRPLGHPARAPLTSLLDPLLSHWGLRLEPAEFEVGGVHDERRALAGGALLQLAGASRFALSGNTSTCTLSDRGLLARCRVGQGRALLVADADWIDDARWTMTPDSPGDRGAWTSDAVDVASAWLLGETPRVAPLGTWLVDQDGLVGALRMALGLLLLLVIGDAWVAGRPKAARTSLHTKVDQIWNKGKTGLDST